MKLCNKELIQRVRNSSASLMIGFKIYLSSVDAWWKDAWMN
jgi:hypothetical protein